MGIPQRETETAIPKQQSHCFVASASADRCS